MYTNSSNLDYNEKLIWLFTNDNGSILKIISKFITTYCGKLGI